MRHPRTRSPLAPGMLVLAVLPALLAAALVFAPSLIEPFWPLPSTSDQAFIFLGSILAAAAASTAWAAREGEDVSFGGIGLDTAVIFWPLAIWLVTLDPGKGGGPSLVVIVAIGAGIFGTWLTWRTARAPFGDPRPTPRLVFVAFGVFVVVLLLAAGALIGGRPNTLPWSTTREGATLTGLIFLGAASYFVFGLVRRGWPARGLPRLRPGAHPAARRQGRLDPRLLARQPVGVPRCAHRQRSHRRVVPVPRPTDAPAGALLTVRWATAGVSPGR